MVERTALRMRSARRERVRPSGGNNRNHANDQLPNRLPIIGLTDECCRR